MHPTIRLARFMERSEANGPGERSVFWVQGCSLSCVGCINKWSWPKETAGTQDITPEMMASMVGEDVEGVTLSGGEPFQQNISALVKFLGLVSWRGRGHKTVTIFTGYTLRELGDMADQDRDYLRALSMVDLLIAGRYDRTKRVQGEPLIGSSNQHIHYLTGHYGPADLQRVAAMEIHIDMGSNISTTTGITSP